MAIMDAQDVSDTRPKRQSSSTPGPATGSKKNTPVKASKGDTTWSQGHRDQQGREAKTHSLFDLLAAVDMVEQWKISPAQQQGPRPNDEDVPSPSYRQPDVGQVYVDPFSLHVPRRKRSSRGGSQDRAVGQRALELRKRMSLVELASQLTHGLPAAPDSTLRSGAAVDYPERPAKRASLSSGVPRGAQAAPDCMDTAAYHAVPLAALPAPMAAAPSVTQPPPARQHSASVGGALQVHDAQALFTSAQLKSWRQGTETMHVADALMMRQATQALRAAQEQQLQEMRVQLQQLMREASRLGVHVSLPDALRTLATPAHNSEHISPSGTHTGPHNQARVSPDPAAGQPAASVRQPQSQQGGSPNSSVPVLHLGSEGSGQPTSLKLQSQTAVAQSQPLVVVPRDTQSSPPNSTHARQSASPPNHPSQPASTQAKADALAGACDGADAQQAMAKQPSGTLRLGSGTSSSTFASLPPGYCALMPAGSITSQGGAQSMSSGGGAPMLYRLSSFGGSGMSGGGAVASMFHQGGAGLSASQWPMGADMGAYMAAMGAPAAHGSFGGAGAVCYVQASNSGAMAKGGQQHVMMTGAPHPMMYRVPTSASQQRTSSFQQPQHMQQ